ncbi:ADP-ribosyltransferase domain-containing protein [Vibrio hepatarius]|uniref:ADP-ribosyltransferase domain-containing protein n=1 Tax=Vibrio hepatarius TaxID=171383 RepID=UPI001C081D8F|nr:ADP-ribosyltransferase domain-containing protein [Vibrio hepatarius]MBU2898099.1 2'-5' RNA ligase family protein [Vibrio hepatarius]
MIKKKLLILSMLSIPLYSLANISEFDDEKREEYLPELTQNKPKKLIFDLFNEENEVLSLNTTVNREIRALVKDSVNELTLDDVKVIREFGKENGYQTFKPGAYIGLVNFIKQQGFDGQIDAGVLLSTIAMLNANLDSVLINNPSNPNFQEMKIVQALCKKNSLSLTNISIISQELVIENNDRVTYRNLIDKVSEVAHTPEIEQEELLSFLGAKNGNNLAWLQFDQKSQEVISEKIIKPLLDREKANALSERYPAVSKYLIGRMIEGWTRYQIHNSDGLSIEQYSALKIYSGSSYTEINSALRTGVDFDLWKNVVEDAKSGIYVLAQKANESGRHDLLFRGYGSKSNAPYHPNAYTEGDVIQDKAFVSSSEDIDVANFFKNGYSGNDATIMHIFSEKGGPIEDISTFPGEQEVLFEPSTEFKLLLKAFDEKNGIFKLVLEDADAPSDKGSKGYADALTDLPVGPKKRKSESESLYDSMALEIPVKPSNIQTDQQKGHPLTSNEGIKVHIGRVTKTNDMHITVAFFGKLANKDFIRNVRSDVNREVTVTFNKAEMFNNNLVLTSDVGSELEELKEIHNGLIEEANAEGLKLNEKYNGGNYRPHLTLARDVPIEKQADLLEYLSFLTESPISVMGNVTIGYTSMYTKDSEQSHFHDINSADGWGDYLMKAVSDLWYQYKP